MIPTAAGLLVERHRSTLAGLDSVGRCATSGADARRRPARARKCVGMLGAETPRGYGATTLVASSVLAGTLYVATLVFVHATEDVYGIPPWGVAATVVLVLVALVGAGLMLWSRQAGLSAIVFVAVALGVFGVLAILSIGIAALLAAGGLVALAVTREWPGQRTMQAFAGAVLAGAALPILIVFALAGPLVTCDTNGASSGENLFMGLLSGTGSTSISSGGSTTSPDGTATGHSEGSGYAYSFACRDGKLVRFSLRWR